MLTFGLVPMEKAWALLSPRYELNSITAVFLQWRLWHQIIHEWYVIKQKEWLFGSLSLIHKYYTEWLLRVLSSSSSSSSSHAANTDLPDPLSPPVSIVHRFWEVFQATSCISTELLYIGSRWFSNCCSSMWSGPLEHITYEFFCTSPVVSRFSRLSNLETFRDGCLMAVQLLFGWVLPPGLVQYSWQHSCVIAVKLFLHTFC